MQPTWGMCTLHRALIDMDVMCSPHGAWALYAAHMGQVHLMQGPDRHRGLQPLTSACALAARPPTCLPTCLPACSQVLAGLCEQTSGDVCIAQGRAPSLAAARPLSLEARMAKVRGRRVTLVCA